MRRWTLALAVAVALAAPTTSLAAGPDFTPPPDRYPTVVTESNVAIPMPDGTVLRASIRHPGNADGSMAAGKFPGVLTMTPYNKVALQGGSGVATLAGAPELLVHQGYVAVTVDVRGTGNSEGTWDSFGPAEQADSLEIVKWLRAQAWSDGTYATYGASYMAINQFLLAARNPPGLKAMFTVIPAADVYRDVVWHGGSVDAGFIPLWMGLVTGLGLLPTDDLQSDPAAALQALADHVGGATTFQTAAITSLATRGDLAFDGDFYKQRSPEQVVGKVNVPVFIVGGWWDLFQRGEPRLYNALKLKPGRKQLLMGPWYHVTAGDGLGGPGYPPAMERLGLAWLDRWVKGRENHVEDYGPVTLYELGTGTWATQSTYPGPVTARRLYLREGKGLSETAPTAATTDTVLANPVNGLCTRSTAQWTAGLVIPGAQCTDDQRLYEASGLTYTTAPLDKPLRIVGPLALQLRTSTTASDTTWIATLTDVDPSGKSNPITSGWLMPSRRAIDESRSVRAENRDLIVPFHPFTKDSLQPVVSGQVDTLNVELFGTDAVFQAGHRIRVVLTHGDLPHLLSTVPDTVSQVGAVDQVHIDPKNPSFLTVGELASRGILGEAGSGGRCLSRRNFVIHLVSPGHGVRIRKATIKIGKRSIRARRVSGRWTARVDLRGLPKQRVVVSVRAVGSDGRVYRGTRAYRTCTRKKKR